MDPGENRVLQEVLKLVPPSTRCNAICKAWQAFLNPSNDKDDLSPPTPPTSPCLLFLTPDSLLLHNLFEGSPWLPLPLSLPHPHSLISKAWSSGPLLLILLGSSLSPFHPGRLSLWNPLSLSLSKLPAFASIWHLISLGSHDHVIVAAGFDRNIQCVIELYHVDGASPSAWHVLGRLPLARNVQEHDEILFCDGFFYALCMESSMLHIDPRELAFTFHDVPYSSSPKLIASRDCIFMVDMDRLLGSFVLWKYDTQHDHWQARTVDSPFYGLFVKVIDVKGIGTSICFVLSSFSVMVYDVLKELWHSLMDCPSMPSSRALVWEPRIVL